jgi:hypothetical protein
MRRQVQISVEVYPSDEDDSLEEMEFILSDESTTEDLHRIFMCIAHFLTYDIKSMEEIACNDCDLCDGCTVKEDAASLQEELNDMTSEKETLQIKNAELAGKLERYDTACFSAGKTCNPCPASSPVNEPDPARAHNWYIPPGD